MSTKTHFIRSALIMTGAALLLAGCGHNTGPYPFIQGGKHTEIWFQHHRKQDREQAKWCERHDWRDHRRLTHICRMPVGVYQHNQ